jgi:MFS superfamily sulfate permease-like transporter
MKSQPTITTSLFTLTILSFAIWVTMTYGWFALGLYLFLCAVISLAFDVVRIMRVINDGKSGK